MELNTQGAKNVATFFKIWLVSVLFFTVSAFAQTQWTRQSANPQPRNLSGVEWTSPTHGFIAGDNLTLMETYDGGATWRRISLTTNASTSPLYEVYFRDANNGFAFGNSASTGADVFRTTDGGANWQRISNFPLGGSWYQMDFVSPTIGFMGANGAIARTTDGGATWQIRGNNSSAPIVYGMDFRDEQTGIVGGNSTSSSGGPGIFKTTDGGASWTKKYSQSANDVLWLSNTTVIAASASVLRSMDAGETWSVLSNDVTTGLTDLELLPGGVIVGVSSAGDAWRSADGGVTWQRTLVGIGALPADWAVDFFDSQNGSIVGQGGMIFKTTNGGFSWTQMNSGIGGVEFRDIEMFTDREGLAVGDNGYLLRTTNGGKFWETKRLQVTGVVLFRNENLQALSIVDDQFAVAAGFDGVVYKTFDRGRTWQSIGYPNLPGEYFISDVKFITRNLGYVTGTRPEESRGTFRTTDGGQTWELLELNIGHSIDFVDANHGWIMNTGGLGYRTTNGGASWQQMIMPNQGFSPTISKIDFANENVGYAVGWYGYAARTTDGGQTWQLQNISTQQEKILGLHVVSPSEAYAVGLRASGSVYLYHTTNAGATWQKSLTPEYYSLSGVYASPSGRIWVSGYDGTILFSGQNVPNTNTKFDFDGDGKTDISIYRPATGEWWMLKSSNGGNMAFQFGNSNDKIVPADFTGDGRTDVAVFRPSTGEWFILRSEDGSFYSFPFGASGDVPAPGDFDGDGRADAAVFRPSTGTWYINKSSGGTLIQQFGINGDVPVMGDFDGDGKDDIAVYRPSNGQWWIQRSSLGTIAYTFGTSSDKPVSADYTGDGKTDVAIWRPSTGEWFILRSENDSYYSFPFGMDGDVPASGDYDGDGKQDAAVFRPSSSTWYIQRSSAGTSIQSFGFAGDRPVPSAFVP